MRFLLTFELSAVCHLNVERAEAFAAEAEKRLDKRPAVYTLDEENLTAVSVLLNHDLHHTVAEELPQVIMCKCKNH